MSRFLLVASFLFLLFLSFVSAEVFVFDDYKLPLNTSVNVTYGLVPNETLFFNPDGGHPALWVSHPTSYTLGVNESNATITYDISIDNFTLDGNESFNYSIFVNNSYNSLSTTTVFSFLIVDNFQYYVPESYDLLLLGGLPVVNVSYYWLPVDGSHEIVVRGLKDSFVNITCYGDWLSCPQKEFFDENNETTVIIDYVVPLNTSVGEYVYNVTLSSYNDTVVIPFTFNVYLPNIIVDTFSWGEECFSGDVDDLIDCVEEYEDWASLRLSEVLRSAREQSVCEPEIINHTEYVVVGDVDKDLYDELEQCRSDLDSSISDFSRCRSESSNYQRDYEVTLSSLDECRFDLMDNESKTRLACEAKIFSMRNETEMMIRNDMVSRWWGRFFFVLFIGLFFLGRFLYLRYRENSWGVY